MIENTNNKKREQFCAFRKLILESLKVRCLARFLFNNHLPDLKQEKLDGTIIIVLLLTDSVVFAAGFVCFSASDRAPPPPISFCSSSTTMWNYMSCLSVRSSHGVSSGGRTTLGSVKRLWTSPTSVANRLFPDVIWPFLVKPFSQSAAVLGGSGCVCERKYEIIENGRTTAKRAQRMQWRNDSRLTVGFKSCLSAAASPASSHEEHLVLAVNVALSPTLPGLHVTRIGAKEASCVEPSRKNNKKRLHPTVGECQNYMGALRLPLLQNVTRIWIRGAEGCVR